VNEPNCDFVAVVSGLPRSGTSMMMQMLEAGGMQVVSDRIRKSDEDNLKGYYEFEPVKSIKRDAPWLADAAGKAVKIVYMLLKDLPASYRYRVIFMRRDLGEVVRSQQAMLDRNGQPGAQLTERELIDMFTRQLERTHQWLAQQPNFAVIDVQHRDVITDAEAQARRIREFLGMPLDVAAMAAAVDPALYRQRAN
jgi:hypothetical protein